MARAFYFSKIFMIREFSLRPLRACSEIAIDPRPAGVGDGCATDT
jgi:hypothetical protein